LPEGRGPQYDECETGRDRQQSTVVVSGHPAVAPVVDRLGGSDHAQQTEHYRDRSACAGSQPGIGPDCEHEDYEGDEAAEEVITGRGARLRLKEAVVSDMNPDHAGGDREDQGLIAWREHLRRGPECGWHDWSLRIVEWVSRPERLIVGPWGSVPLLEALVGRPAPGSLADMPPAVGGTGVAGIREQVTERALPGHESPPAGRTERDALCS